MLVEFIGCTGSGKSTIATEVINHLKRSGLDFESLDLGGHLRYDFISLPWFIKYSIHDVKLCSLALVTLRENVDSIANGLNLFRNFAKKVGMYELLRKKTSKRNVIWDEGTVHAAHNLFVHAYEKPDVSAVCEFARLVPLPDLIIYVKSPRNALIARALARGHNRINQEKNIPRFIDNAIHVFEILVSQARIKDKLIIVENNENGLTGIEPIAENISEYIINALSFH
jgi:thymidylate kinase